MVSLNTLIEFKPNDNIEREMFKNCKKDVLNIYLSDTKTKWARGQFYLGGFIKMNLNEEITLKKIDEVKVQREKAYEDYGICNRWEQDSILRCEMQLSEIEKIVKIYLEILKRRYLKELEKINLNNDVNHIILSYIF